MSLSLRLVLGAALFCGVANFASAAILADLNFNNGLPPDTNISSSGLTETNSNANSNYSLTGTALSFTSSATSNGTTASATNSSAALEVLGLGNPQNFRVSTNFVLDSFAGANDSTLNFGFGLFGTASNFSTGNQYRVLFTPYALNSASARRLSIAEVAGGTSSSTVTSGQLDTGVVIGGMSGTITVEGTYNSGSLQLVATLVTGGNTLTATLTDATPLTGTWFGYRTAINAVGTTGVNFTASENVTYDNFLVQTVEAVPEPGSVALLSIAALGFGWSLRRRLA